MSPNQFMAVLAYPLAWRAMKDLRVDPDLIRGALERLVAVPSIAFKGFPREPRDGGGGMVGQLLRGAGPAEIHSVDVSGEAPTILADFPGPGPTVLLYAHY